MTFEETSKALNTAILQTSPAEIPEFLLEHAGDFPPRPFTDFMRLKFREKGLTQQDIFLAADLNERFGYKLISGEKRTKQRDTILRICLAARFGLEETQEALILYGMAPLHGRFPRDCAFMIAFYRRIFDIHEVDTMLRENNLPPFLTAESQ